MTSFAREQVLPARERLLEAAYALFVARGVYRVGIDTVLADSGCAKATLYRNFGSKQKLILAFLQRHEQRWTYDWLEAGLRSHSTDPEGRLLAVFDLFDQWFRREDFTGCAFIHTLVDADDDEAVHQAAAEHLARVRGILRGFAEAARLEDVEAFVQVWQMLMKGSVVAAVEGNPDAARQARQGAGLVLAGWRRREP